MISVNVMDPRSREFNSVQFVCINIFSLLMPNKLLHTWCGDYCECARPSQLPVLTEVRAPSLLEQYPRYVPHRDRAGYIMAVFPLSHDSCQQPHAYVKPDVAITVFELLRMSGVLLETCWAIKKHWNNKFYYMVVSCWSFLYDLYYDAWIHEHQVDLAFFSSPNSSLWFSFS
jgi:hypothetical protein